MSSRSASYFDALKCVLLTLMVAFSVFSGTCAAVAGPLHTVGPTYRLQSVALGPQGAVAVICHPRIPQADCEAAVFVYEFVLTHNWAPPDGYVGGKKFIDKNGALPPGGNYKEYDIYPKPPPNSGGRDAKRIVISMESQIMFYTADHFATFVKLTYS